MRYIIIAIVALSLFGCSKKAQKTDNVVTKREKIEIDTKYKFQKLNVKELYPEDDKKLISKIDSSNVQETGSKFYQMDKFDRKWVYVKRSPYDIFEKIKNLKELSINDQKLYLKYALELGKNSEIDKVLPFFKEVKFPYTDLIDVAFDLFHFDKKDKAISLLEYRVDSMIKNRVDDKELPIFKKELFKILDSIKNIKESSLEGFSTENYLAQLIKVYPKDTDFLSKYVDILNSKKLYDRSIEILTPLLENKKLKSFAIYKLINIYKLKKDENKIVKLYEENIKLPEEITLFNSYISYLKGKNGWSEKLLSYQQNFNKNKDLQSFYYYYYSLSYDGLTKKIKNLFKQFEKILKDNPDERSYYVLGDLYKLKGYYNDSYRVVNRSLINYKKGEYYEKNLLLAIDVLRYKSYNFNYYEDIFFYNSPDIVGGLLSLIHNSFRYLNTSQEITSANNRLMRDDDIEYLYKNYYNLIKDEKIKKDFLLSYFYYLRNRGDRDQIKSIASDMLKKVKDIEFKLELLKTIVNLSKNSSEKNRVLAVYEELLENNKDNSKKFDQIFNNLISFLKSNYKSEQIVDNLQKYLDNYPNYEKIYVELLNILDYYRFYNKEVNVYKKALNAFKTKGWLDKFARFLIRRNMYSEIENLNQELMNIKSSKEFINYLVNYFPRGKYGQYTNSYNQFYEKIYLMALEKYPFNKTIVNKIIYFYTSFSKYYSSNKRAIQKGKELRIKYMFIFDNYREQYFRDTIRNNKYYIQALLEKIESKKTKNIPELIFEAETHKFMSRFEKAIEAYQIIASYYSTDKNIIFDTAKLLKSLASSFYINDPNYLKTAERYFKRLTFLDRFSSKYYISLAELYYALNETDKAKNTLFRALEYQKNVASIYREIGDVFYDFYDYDSALKVFYIYAERTGKKHNFHPVIGRLYELKNRYDLAIDQYVDDMIFNSYNSYQSRKRLKNIYFMDKKYQKVIENRVWSLKDKIVNDVMIIEAIQSLFLSLNNKDFIYKIYLEAYEKSEKRDILKLCYNYFIRKKHKDLVGKVLTKMEKKFPDEQLYNLLISHYLKDEKGEKVVVYYKKLLALYPPENDLYRYQDIFERYINYLLGKKQYSKVIEEMEQRISYIDKKEHEYLFVSLNKKLAKYYAMDGKRDKEISILKTLHKEYPENYQIIQDIFGFYKKGKDSVNLSQFLKDLIKATKKSKYLTYYQKRDRVETFRTMLITELKKMKKHIEVQNQYIEILNKNPYNYYALNSIYDYSKKFDILKRIENFYAKTVKKSFRDHRYMLLMGNLLTYDKRYDQALEYFEKARRLEPQKDSIVLSIADIYYKQGKYINVYQIYKNLQDKQSKSGSYQYKYWENRLFEIALKLKDDEKIYKHLYYLVGKPEDYNDGIRSYSIENIATQLYQNRYFDLAKKYFDKYMKKVIFKDKGYLSSSVYYKYFQTELKAGTIVEFLDKFIGYYDDLDKTYTKKYGYYKKRSNQTTLTYLLSKYIPDNLQYLSKSKFYELNRAIDDLKNRRSIDKKITTAMADYYSKTYQFDKYEKVIDSRYVDGWRYNFYKGRLMFDKMLEKRIFTSSTYNVTYYTNTYGTVLEYIWGDKNRSEQKLGDLFSYKCGYSGSYHGYGVDIYLDWLYKNGISKYESLISNRCQFSRILAHYISKKRKDLALKLIDNQTGNSVWKLKEKISVYNKLKDYSKEGLDLYKELLSVEDTISQQISESGDSKLDGKTWDRYLRQYASYGAKGELFDPEKYILNIVEVSPKSQSSYIAIGSFYKELKKYDKAEKYYLYAKKLKDNDYINGELLELYYKMGENKKFQTIKNKLLKTKSIITFSNLYYRLKNLKILDDQFINSYQDRFEKDMETYGYNRLSSYMNEIMDYYIDNDRFESFMVFADSLKIDSIYHTLLYNSKVNPKVKRDFISKIFKKHLDNKDHYSAKEYLILLIEYDLYYKNYNSAKTLFDSYGESILKRDYRAQYDELNLRIAYLSKDIITITKILENALTNSVTYSENDYDEYNGGYYNSGNLFYSFKRFIEDDDDSKYVKTLADKFYNIIKASNKVTNYEKIDFVKYLSKDRAKNEIENFDYSKIYNTQFNSLKNITIDRGMIEVIPKIAKIGVDRFCKKDYSNKLYYGADDYKNCLDNVLLSKQYDKLSNYIKDRPLSLSELNTILGFIDKYPMVLIDDIIGSENIFSGEEDLKVILSKAYLRRGNYDKVIENIESINSIKLQPLKFKLLATSYINKGEWNSKLQNYIKKAIYYNPTARNLKLSLFKYYVENKEEKKAVAILDELGIGFLVVFDKLVTKYLEKPYFRNSNDYNRGYYGYDSYSYQDRVKNIVKYGKDGIKYKAIDNFLNSYLDTDQTYIANFLYKIYKKYSNKDLGLHLLNYLSKKDKGYVDEFNRLKNSK